MRKPFALALAASLLAGVGIVGCGEESSVKEETQITTPGGETTIQKETSVETTGENPPVAAPGTNP